jgi:hypothetical protein
MEIRVLKKLRFKFSLERVGNLRDWGEFGREIRAVSYFKRGFS